MKKRALLLTAALGAIAAYAYPAMAQTAATPAQPDMDAGADIVVTASKRDERLRDVPAAITALSGDKLDQLGVHSFRDYSTLVPGLSMRDTGAPGLGTIIIRGLNTGPQQTTNTAAFYIDEAPFSASGFLSLGASLTPEPELADIDRVEVLKGPQGTLYGASSLGGLIRIVTRKPDLEHFSGSARAEVSTVDGGGTGYLFRGSANIPIVTDKIGLTATGFYRRAPGFADNVRTGSDNLNHSELAGGRLALRLKPTERLTVDLSGLYQNIDSAGFAYEQLLPGTLTPAYGRDKFSSFKDIGSRVRYRVASATADYDAGAAGTLTASASYGYFRGYNANDATSVYLPAGRAALATVAMSRFGLPLESVLPSTSNIQANLSPGTKKFTTEARFTSKRLWRIEFIAGVYYTDERSHYVVNYNVYDANNVLRPAPFTTLISSITSSHYQEVAGFGDATLYITDKFDVGGGIRYAHNKQLNETGGPGAVTYFIPRATIDFPTTDDAVTYLATARWRPIPTVSFYLRAASGYRPGGPQTNPAPPAGAQTVILADTVWNYEGGAKASLFSGLINIDASVFHIDWKNIQLNALFNGIQLQGNGGQAQVDGVEAEILLRPTRLLTIGLNGGYTNARLTQISPGTATSLGAQVGDHLPLTPKKTVALFGDQHIPLSETLSATVGGTLRYQSEMPNAYGAQVGTAKLSHITTADMRAGLAWGRYTIDARIENVADAGGITQVTGNYAVIIRPRTFSLGAGVKF